MYQEKSGNPARSFYQNLFGRRPQFSSGDVLARLQYRAQVKLSIVNNDPNLVQNLVLTLAPVLRFDVEVQNVEVQNVKRQNVEVQNVKNKMSKSKMSKLG
jgi:hypothetical protein